MPAKRKDTTTRRVLTINKDLSDRHEKELPKLMGKLDKKNLISQWAERNMRKDLGDE